MEPYPDSPVFLDEPSSLRTPVLWAIAAILFVAVITGAVLLWRNTATDQKTAQFLNAAAAAPDNAARLALTKSHLSVPASAPELLALGGSFLKAGKLDQAEQAFTLFIQNFPRHPLIAGAQLGLAQVLAAQGKADDAIPLLQTIAASHETGAEGFQPAALLALAELRQAKKDLPGSRQALEELIAKYPGSAFTAPAQALLGSVAN
ncbi:MAG: tetratricopeptide repeat protein [Verrucomicrobium sp.]|nr:tetratricopeptide repeat protein [Verrucomicrobium sp.]